MAVDDPGNTTDEDNAIIITVLTNDSDPDGDPLTIVAAGPASNGAVTNNGTSVTYNPNLNYNGLDSFSYTISDGSLTDAATVAITITAVNDPPVAGNDTAATNQDVPVAINVAANDNDDRDGGTIDPTSVMTATNPVSGSVVVSSGGTITYTPNPGISGIDTFDYQVCDTGTTPPPPQCSTATVTVTITDTVPAAPINLRAAAGDSQISLGWDHNPPADLVGYRVYRSDNGGSFNFISTTLVITRYLDRPLTNTFTYAYTVTAIDAANESGPSNIASATPDTIITNTTVITCGGSTVTNCSNAQGAPDGAPADIDGTGVITFDFGAGQGIIDGPSWDLVFYESLNTPARILLDYTRVELSADGVIWYTVFEWDGDPPPGDILGTNIDSFASDGNGELENEIIPVGSLYPFPGTGIAIDIGGVQTPPPAGLSYRYVRISYPAGGTDFAQIDAVERLN